MITNEQIEKLKHLHACKFATCGNERDALRAAISTLERLPIYADTGARFVPGVDEAWIVIDNGESEIPGDDTPRFVVCQAWLEWSGDAWGPDNRFERANWTGKFYSGEQAAIAAKRKDGDK